MNLGMIYQTIVIPNVHIDIVSIFKKSNVCELHSLV